MAEVALELELAADRRQPFYLRWYRAHASTARGLLSLLIVALVWEAAGRSGRWPLILAPLSDILAKFVQLAATGELQRHVLVSLNEFIVGIAAASKMAVVFLLAVFPIVINTATGIRSTEQIYIDAARSFSASRRQIFTKVLIPSALPFIVAGLRLGIGRGLVGVVVGEFIGARAGLGYLIFRSSQGFEIDAMWAGVFLLAGTGVLSVILLQKVERRMAPWRRFELK